LRLSKVATKRSFASRIESMRPGTWWSVLGGLSQERTLWIFKRIQAWSRFARRSLMGAQSFCWVGGTFGSTQNLRLVGSRLRF
jgi:hypothetical protein